MLNEISYHDKMCIPRSLAALFELCNASISGHKVYDEQSQSPKHGTRRRQPGNVTGVLQKPDVAVSGGGDGDCGSLDNHYCDGNRVW